MRLPADPKVLAAASASAVLLSMAHRPGFSGWWGLVAVAPVLLAASGSTRLRYLAVAALIAGTGASFPMFEGVLPVLPWTFVPLVVAFTPQVLLPLLAWRHLGGFRGGPRAALATASTWLLCESLARAPVWGGLAGFYSLGYSQFDTGLLGLARLSGPGLLSFLLVLCSAAVAQLRGRDWRSLAACLLLAPPLLMIGNPRLDLPGEAGQLHVTLVQPGFSSLEYALATIDPQAAEAHARKLALLGLREGEADLMVWPETVLSPLVRADFVTGLLPGSTRLLVGRIERAGSHSYNAVMLPGASGWESVQRKAYPVPLLETRFLSAGVPGATLAYPGLPVLGALVCLDSAHAAPALRAARAGAALLVVLSNSEFSVLGQTPELHLRVSAFRAVELGLPVAFSSSSGPSGLIDPHGRVLGRTEAGVQSAVRVAVPQRLESTPYLMAGDWFSWIACPPLLLMFRSVFRCRVLPGSGAGRSLPRVLPARASRSSGRGPA